MSEKFEIDKLDGYQALAQKTDQYKELGSSQRLAMPFLGLFEDAGDVSRIYKEIICAGNEIEEGRRKELEEKLGDVLWFVTNIAEKTGLKLGEIARRNIDLTQDRWVGLNETGNLYDEAYPVDQQLPRRIEIFFRSVGESPTDTKILMFVKDQNNNEIPLGDRLNDNSYDEDGYRYHDVLHLAYYAILGWSPVMRALLKKKRKQNSKIDEVEDGARAILLEEAITAYVFQFANKSPNNLFEGRANVDTKLLKPIREITRHLEVKDKTLRQWEKAILEGYKIFREIKSHREGSVSIDLNARTIKFCPPDRSDSTPSTT